MGPALFPAKKIWAALEGQAAQPQLRGEAPAQPCTRGQAGGGCHRCAPASAHRALPGLGTGHSGRGYGCGSWLFIYGRRGTAGEPGQPSGCVRSAEAGHPGSSPAAPSGRRSWEGTCWCWCWRCGCSCPAPGSITRRRPSASWRPRRSSTGEQRSRGAAVCLRLGAPRKTRPETPLGNSSPRGCPCRAAQGIPGGAAPGERAGCWEAGTGCPGGSPCLGQAGSVWLCPQGRPRFHAGAPIPNSIGWLVSLSGSPWPCSHQPSTEPEDVGMVTREGRRGSQCTRAAPSTSPAILRGAGHRMTVTSLRW